MSELDELRAVIGRPGTDLASLRSLLRSTEEQLIRYEQARRVITDAGPDGWNYHVFQESLRVGSGSATSSVTEAEWEMMFPDARLQLRTQSLATLDEGSDLFQQIKTMIEGEIATRQPKEGKGWRFWKS